MEKTPVIHGKPHIAAPNYKKTKTKRDISRYDAFDGGFNPVRGEMAMWRSVITQALMDASSNSRKSETQYHKREALKWLLTESDDFTTVCDYAGLEPDYARYKIRAALTRNCRWRAEAVKRPARIVPIEFKSVAVSQASYLALLPLEACA